MPSGSVAQRIAVPGTWPDLTDDDRSAPHAFVSGKLVILVSDIDPVRIAAYDANARNVWTLPLKAIASEVFLEGDDLIFSARPADAGSTVLFDIAAATGKTRWTRPSSYFGVVGADRDGIVVAADTGLAAYDREGKKMWGVPSATVDRRIVLTGDLVVGLGSIPGADDEPERGAVLLSSYDRNGGKEIAQDRVPDTVYFSGTHAIVQYSNAVVKGFESPDDPRFQASCCASVLDVTDLHHASPSQTATPPAKPSFAASTVTIAPDMRANVDRSLNVEACPELPPISAEPGVFPIGTGEVFYVGRAHRVYAFTGATVRGAPLEDTCLASTAAIGSNRIAWHAGSLSVLRSGPAGVSLVPLHAPLHRRDIVASLAGGERFYFATTTSLYAVDPSTLHETVWPIAGCAELLEPASATPSTMLECGRANGRVEIFDLR